MIDWNFIVQGYNRKYHTNFTELEMWHELYPKYTCFQLDEILGVCHMSIMRRLHQLPEITVEPPGQRRPCRLDKFKAIPKDERDNILE